MTHTRTASDICERNSYGRDATVITSGVKSNMNDRIDQFQTRTPSMVPDSGNNGRRLQAYRTLMSLGGAYFLICLSYGTFETLQSTLNVGGGLGTTTVGVMFACAIASSLFLAPTIVDRLGAKTTLYVAWCVLALYTGANAVPCWETLLPTSAAVGVTFAATNIVYGVYVTTLAEEATQTFHSTPEELSGTASTNTASKDGVDRGQGHRPKSADRRQMDNAVVRFNSILLTFINAGSIIGSMLGSLVIGSATGRPSDATNLTLNSSGHRWTDDGLFDNLYYEDLHLTNSTSYWQPEMVDKETSTIATTAEGTTTSFCGVDHCPFLVEHVSGFVPTDRTVVYVVAAFAVAVNLAAIGVIAILLPPPRESKSSNVGWRKSKAETDKRIHIESYSGKTADDKLLAEDGVVVRLASNDKRTDPVDAVVDKKAKIPTAGDYVRTRVVGTFQLLADYRLQLLIPSIALIGVINSLAIGAFNQSFVACLLGVNAIGYATLAFRGALILFSLLAGQLSNCVRRRSIIVAAQLSFITAIVTWFVSMPSKSGAAAESSELVLSAVVFTWCAANGAVLGLLRTAVFAMYPRLFREKLSFALAQASVWESLGAAITFLINDRLCFGTKAYGFGALAVVSLTMYVILECLVDQSSSFDASVGDEIVIVARSLSLISLRAGEFGDAAAFKSTEQDEKTKKDGKLDKNSEFDVESCLLAKDDGHQLQDNNIAVVENSPKTLQRTLSKYA